MIDRAGLDPVRIAARELVEAIHCNDDTKRWSDDTIAAFGALEALL